MKSAGYLISWVKEPTKIAAITPSSRFVTRKMISHIDFDSARKIVEFGAGDGVMTRQILKRMNPDAKLYVFEIHSPFVKLLKKIKDKGLLL